MGVMRRKGLSGRPAATRRGDAGKARKKQRRCGRQRHDIGVSVAEKEIVEAQRGLTLGDADDAQFIDRRRAKRIYEKLLALVRRQRCKERNLNAAQETDEAGRVALHERAAKPRRETCEVDGQEGEQAAAARDRNGVSDNDVIQRPDAERVAGVSLFRNSKRAFRSRHGREREPVFEIGITLVEQHRRSNAFKLYGNRRSRGICSGNCGNHKSTEKRTDMTETPQRIPPIAKARSAKIRLRSFRNGIFMVKKLVAAA